MKNRSCLLKKFLPDVKTVKVNKLGDLNPTIEKLDKKKRRRNKSIDMMPIMIQTSNPIKDNIGDNDDDIIKPF